MNYPDISKWKCTTSLKNIENIFESSSFTNSLSNIQSSSYSNKSSNEIIGSEIYRDSSILSNSYIFDIKNNEIYDNFYN